jgi:hypothetical protein
MTAAAAQKPQGQDLRSHHLRPAEMPWQKTRFPGCVGAGEFVWRSAGSRHTAWSPKGGTFIAIFQIPNKFYEADGRVTDAAGKDWDEVWGDLLPK